PSEGMYDYYPPSAWVGDVEQYYEFLLGRHIGIYRNPTDWTAEQIHRFRLFNDWRKSPRIEAILSELVRPIYNSATHDRLAVGAHTDSTQNDGPYAWMFRDDRQTSAILVAVGGSTTTSPNVRRFMPTLRWLDCNQTYFVTDMSLDDSGAFASEYVGSYSGGS